jgi:hypothetical protein
MTDIFFASSWAYGATVAQVNAEAISGAASDLESIDPAGVGGKSLRTNTTARVWLPCANPGTHWCLHFWGMKVAGSGTGSNPFLGFSDSSQAFGVHIRAGAFSGNRFNVNNGATVLYTGIQDSANTNAFYRLEVIEHSSNGEVLFYRGEDLLYHGTNLNTSRSLTADRLFIGPNQANGDQWRVSHVILASENLGSSAVVQYFPVATDETPNEWTKSNGSLDYFEHLDDVPTDGDTTYLLSSDEGDRTTHKPGVSGLTTRLIHGVQLWAVSRLEVASEDRLALRIDGDSTIVGNISHTQYTGRGSSWYGETPGEEEWTGVNIQDAVLQVEHLAPEE